MWCKHLYFHSFLNVTKWTATGGHGARDVCISAQNKQRGTRALFLQARFKEIAEDPSIRRGTRRNKLWGGVQVVFEGILPVRLQPARAGQDRAAKADY